MPDRGLYWGDSSGSAQVTAELRSLQVKLVELTGLVLGEEAPNFGSKADYAMVWLDK